MSRSPLAPDTASAQDASARLKRARLRIAGANMIVVLCGKIGNNCILQYAAELQQCGIRRKIGRHCVSTLARNTDKLCMEQVSPFNKKRVGPDVLQIVDKNDRARPDTVTGARVAQLAATCQLPWTIRMRMGAGL